MSMTQLVDMSSLLAYVWFTPLYNPLVVLSHERPQTKPSPLYIQLLHHVSLRLSIRPSPIYCIFRVNAYVYVSDPSRTTIAIG